MSNTHAKRAHRQGAAGRALALAASAVPKSGSGRSSAVTRSMSVAAFPPTSWRSTKPRTSTHTGVRRGFSGLTGSSPLWRVTTKAAVTRRLGPGSQEFLRRRRGWPDRAVGSEGRTDRLGANGAFCFSDVFPPRPATRSGPARRSASPSAPARRPAFPAAPARETASMEHRCRPRTDGASMLFQPEGHQGSMRGSARERGRGGGRSAEEGAEAAGGGRSGQR